VPLIAAADLDRLDRMSAAAHRAILRDATRLILDGVADAKAHAAHAITATLAETREGRPTIAKARNHRSVKAAEGRLARLADGLAGRIEDARLDCYEAAWAFWARRLDKGVLRRNVEWDRAPIRNLARFKALPWHGATIGQFARGPARPLTIALARAVALAGVKGTTPAEQADHLDAWESRARAAFLRVASGLAADAVALADRIAGRDLIDPEFLDPDPAIPWDEARPGT
jgi:hypothetical protein